MKKTWLPGIVPSAKSHQKFYPRVQNSKGSELLEVTELHIKPVIMDLDYVRGRIENHEGVNEVCAKVDFNVFYGVLSLAFPVVGPI